VAVLSALAAFAILAIAVTAAARRRAAGAALRATDQDHVDAIRRARRELKAANREHAAVLREVQRELRRAQAPRELARLAGYTLLDDAIKTSTGTHRLTDAVAATVEGDPHRPCLTIAGVDWVSIAPLPAGDIADARAFVRGRRARRPGGGDGHPPARRARRRAHGPPACRPPRPRPDRRDRRAARAPRGDRAGRRRAPPAHRDRRAPGRAPHRLTSSLNAA